MLSSFIKPVKNNYDDLISNFKIKVQFQILRWVSNSYGQSEKLTFIRLLTEMLVE